ncbi:hypothetical protein A21D_01246 [Virgibacillus dokdonensis]|uniref:SMI1 / KNR4 family protein n=2 Tax=Virgibacillus dokdonensis TaxID=302167 RepID=A0A2K9IY14_9BACI|nr:hypothetical protein A21D_01246 [Virgibacillus dokdonensis]
MNILPDRIDEFLGEEMYKREDKNLVEDALKRLGVNPSVTFREFYNQYEGPFWEEHVPFALLDIVEEEHSIESYTFISRQEHAFFPKQYLVLSEMFLSFR